MFSDKQHQFESLQKDFTKSQERSRALMGTENALASQNEHLEANSKHAEQEVHKLKQIYESKEQNWHNERQDLNTKLQEMLAYNEKVRDECLKKVVGYKDKYVDYKAKVRSANQQIATLTQRVVRYEMRD